MPNWLVLLVAMAALGCLVEAAPPARRAAPAQKPSAGATSRGNLQPKSASSARPRTQHRVGRGRTRGRSSRPAVAQSRRYGQPRPTEERYREIQQALASRGYLQREPASDWRPDCEEALKRFQKDQNLPPNGRITALSLIALGLGPKRNAGAVTAAVPSP